MPTALLCILDGWGWRPEPAPDNAIAAARTPNYTRLLAECPHALLATSGGAVGLPKGQMGNSEVGHMNIGAGRVVAQDLPRIDVAIEDGSLAVTGNYLKVRIPPGCARNEWIQVAIGGTADAMTGTIVDQ